MKFFLNSQKKYEERTKCLFSISNSIIIDVSDTNKNVTQEVQHQGEIIKLKYKRLGRHYLADIAKTESKDVILTSAAYHSQSHILVVGFSNGGFFLYELPSAILIHSLRYEI